MATGDATIKKQGRIVDNRGWREPFFEGRRVNEGLETGARLTPSLGDVVELVFGEVKATHQRPNGAVLWGHGHKSAFDFRQLRDLPAPFGHLHNADDRTFADLFGRRSFVGQTRLNGFESIARDGDLFTVLADDHHFFGRRFQHHRRHDVTVVWMVVQNIVDGLFGLFRVAGQVDEFFRAPVDLTSLKVHEALAQGPVGGHLLTRLDGGVNVQAPGVGVLSVLGKNHLAHGFCHMFGVQNFLVTRGPQFQGLGFGSQCLRCRDEAVFFHALNDVELPRACAFGVVDRVECRGRFGQARQHGRFGNGDVLEGLAEISFAGGRKSIGPMAQENLVHVDFQNLVFAQQVFEFVGQQNFVNFAGEGFFG